MTDRQKKIEEIKQRLDVLSHHSYFALDAQLSELRRYVLYVHTELESMVDMLIAEHMLNVPKGNIDNVINRIEIQLNTSKILDEMDFSKKVKIAHEKFHILPGSLPSQLKAVNQIRVYFSHTIAYHNELEEYKKEDKYLETLEKLEAALTAMLIEVGKYRASGETEYELNDIR